MFVKNLQLGFGISVGIEEVKSFLQFVGEGAVQQLLDSAKRHGAVSVDGFEGRDSGSNLGQKGTHGVGFL